MLWFHVWAVDTYLLDIPIGSYWPRTGQTHFCLKEHQDASKRNLLSSPLSREHSMWPVGPGSTRALSGEEGQVRWSAGIECFGRHLLRPEGGQACCKTFANWAFTLLSRHAVFFDVFWVLEFDANLRCKACVDCSLWNFHCSGRASSELGQGNAR